ncbi:MAG: OmpA family protein [Cyanobacteria bacterium SBLK]|nr:OmpA family protein [Cyanobacteria bacterium SBLK]
MQSPSEDLLEEPLSESSASPVPPSRSGLGGCLGSLVLLVFGSSIAGILGIVVAINNPQETGKKPPLVWIWEKFPFGDREQLPDIVPNSSPDAETQKLQQREQIQAAIANLEKQWQTLQESTAQLEKQLELPETPGVSLDSRLQAIKQKILSLPPLSSTVSGASTAISQVKTPLPGGKLKVTLPSDLLFANHSELSPEGSLILDAIVTDLAKYKGATIRIAAHTDASNSPSQSRELSFQLARTVEQYLASSLRGNYRWISIGYGQTRPLVANNTDGNRQRNRRIEIAVD